MASSAYGQRDIGITGEGMLDGQADNQHWWPWAGKTRFGWQPGMPTGDADAALLAQLADEGAPVISGLRTTNTPNWQVNPVLCTNVTVENVTADSLGPNNEGCDPESCGHVVIRNATFNTGDDCVAVKAGKNADGRRVNVPSQNIVIQDCEFLQGHDAVTIRSEMTGGVRHLFAPIPGSTASR